jgi:transposase
MVLLTNLTKGQVSLLKEAMSTTELYHSHGAKALNFCSHEIKGGSSYYHATVKDKYVVCPVCKSNDVIRQGNVVLTIQSVPFGLQRTFIVVQLPKIYCRNCYLYRQIDPLFFEPYKSVTKKLEQCVIYDSKNMTISSVAERYHLNWDTCERIVIDDLKKRYNKIDISNLRHIAIDEISYKRGHKYLTVVINLDTGNVIYVGEGKDSAALVDFYKLLGPRRCSKIKAVSIDMSKAYISSVTNNLKNATIVFDHFHVVKIFNSKLSNIRIEAAHYASKSGQKILYGARWIILKNPENLDPNKNEPARLKEALSLNETLFTAYYMTDALKKIWEQNNRNDAHSILLEWINSANQSKNRHLIKMGELLVKYMDGILAWYNFNITSGQLEGLNNKIKVLMRRSYGLRNLENLKIRIYAIKEIQKIYTSV